MREDDSPGNFVLRFRPRDRRVDFVGFDAQGAPHVMGDWNAQ